MIFAIDAAPAAMPVNPNMAATIAITIKMIVQRNIKLNLRVKNTNCLTNSIGKSCHDLSFKTGCLYAGVQQLHSMQ